MKEKKSPAELQLPEENQHPGPRNAVENFYENFRHVPLKYLDRFIAGCAAALVLVILLGILKGRGIF